MSRPVIGTRIRERRRALGITQAELARRAGISPSYMNLIEGNRRAVAGSLLLRIADALGLRAEELDGAAERRLLESLHEIAHAPELSGLGIEAPAAGELMARHPGWARALAALARAEREAGTAARALADRLTHDPFLGETVHRMLTRIATIRSAVDILHDFPDVSEERRARFLSIVKDEAAILSEIGEALAAWFDRADAPRGRPTPLDEVEALFEANDNRFPVLEDAAAALGPTIPEAAPSAREAMARQLAESELVPVIDFILAAQDKAETAPGLARARRALISEGAAAALLPAEVFAQRAAALGYDAEALADEFGVGVSTVCRRLAALPRAGGAPRFGWFRANAAGNLFERRGLPGLVVPRYASACPLWALWRAQSTPGTALCQRAIFPSGDVFVFVARAEAAGPAGFRRPRHYTMDMLAVSESDAAATVYARDSDTPAEEVGPACRICPREACPHRAEESIAS